MAIYNFSTASIWIDQDNTAYLVSAINNHSISVDESDENGQTLLMVACHNGKDEIVDELLRLGANVNLADIDDFTPLLNAASEGHFEIVIKLVNYRCKLEDRDGGGWTALMWACYKGYIQIAHYLLEQGASPNMWDQYNISCLAWASGKGHGAIVTDLLHHGAKVNYGDKYGSTPLLWASRKGYKDIVKNLLQLGANVDMIGMHSLTPLMVATKGNFSEVVEILLEYKPNVNAIDIDSGTALTIACKEGFTDIANSLMNSGAYINLQARNGDTNLIQATKAGHFSIVDALIKKYADIDLQGENGKTALYWACERNFPDLCRLILTANPNLEIATKDGDTPLLKATRNRNIEMVHLLMEHNAKVSATDKKGDNALHISMRARSKGIVEVLLRNPKNSQLLYRLNRNRETPYNIDSSYQKPILAQVFGARRLNTNEDNENLLGYDLYSSALADSLSEPSLATPISIGLYAKWGSGKSFLLNKLKSELQNFTYQPLDQRFQFTWIILLVILMICSTSGIAATMAFDYWMVGVFISLGIFIFSYAFLGFIHFSSKHYDLSWSYNIGITISAQMNKLQTFFKVLFCSPPKKIERHTLPVKFLFISQTKITGSGDQTSVSQIVIQLWQEIENEYGFLTTRFCRVLLPKFVDSRQMKWRSICCLPTFIIGVAALILLYGSAVLLFMNFKYPELTLVKPTLITLAVILGVLLIANFYTIVKIAKNLLVSNNRRVSHNFASANNSLDALKGEVSHMSLVAKILDSFLGFQTRMVIIVDGLDSCEPDKVLKLSDHIQVLFYVEQSPFVIIYALDPHIIIRAVESNVNYKPVTGSDYLRNIVHLPFYLQNSGLRKVKAAQMSAQFALKRNTNASHWNEERESSGSFPHLGRKSSTSSGSVPEPFRKSRKGGLKIKASDSVASSINNLHHGMVGAQDLTKVLLTDDYFSDINPRSMRRLLNVVYITARLLKAFNIDFNWYNLASWVNIIERWPTRTSWVILYFELHETEFEETTPLKVIYEKVKPFFPDFHDHLFKEDHDEGKFELLLSMHSTSLVVSDLKMFFPFTINLDPYIRKTIQEENQHLLNVTKENTSSKQVKKSEILRKESLPKLSTRPPIAPKKQSKSPQISFAKDLTIVPPEDEPNSCKEIVKHLKPIRLSTLAVEDVSNYISRIKYIDSTRIPTYQQAVIANNINGMVLLYCDLQELKNVLCMTFGDWELFKLHIQNLREIDLNYSDSDEEQSIKTFLTVESTKPRTTSLEKQVTMEESMLFGALETLNEEAQEDTQEERHQHHQPELIEYSEEPLMYDQTDVDQITETVVGSYSGKADVDVLYLRSPRDSPLPPMGASLSSSIVDIESGIYKQSHSQPIDIVGTHTFHLGGSLASSPSSRVMAHLDSQAVYFRSVGHHEDIHYRSSGSFSSCTSLEKLQKPILKSSSENKSETLTSSGLNINCSEEHLPEEKLFPQQPQSPEEPDNSQSDDENTPLVSPAHSALLPSDISSISLGANAESSQRRFPFERQFSVQLPRDRSMTPERNLRPSHSLSTTLPPKRGSVDDTMISITDALKSPDLNETII